MPRLKKSVVIQRPIDEVFAYVSDQSNVSEWQEGVVESAVASDEPPGVGTRYRNTIEILGRQMEVSGELTAFEPNRTFSFQDRSGSFPASGTFTFREVRGGTEVTLVTQVQPRGAAGMAGPLLAGAMDGMLKASFRKLKDLLEAQA